MLPGAFYLTARRFLTHYLSMPGGDDAGATLYAMITEFFSMEESLVWVSFWYKLWFSGMAMEKMDQHRGGVRYWDLVESSERNLHTVQSRYERTPFPDSICI